MSRQRAVTFGLGALFSTTGLARALPMRTIVEYQWVLVDYLIKEFQRFAHVFPESPARVVPDSVVGLIEAFLGTTLLIGPRDAQRRACVCLALMMGVAMKQLIDRGKFLPMGVMHGGCGACLLWLYKRLEDKQSRKKKKTG